MIYLKLFINFFKTGLFALGGGLVTIPFLSEMGKNYGWFTQEELSNMIAISESTPGPIGTNMATYVGIKVAGIPGGFVATIAEIMPAVIIILLIAKTLNEFRQNKYVDAAFKAVRPSVIGLIASAFVGIFLSAVLNYPLYKSTNNISDLFNYKTIVIFILIFLLNKKWNIHPIFYVCLSAIIGIIFTL